MDLVNSSILEILLPLDTLVIKRPITDEDEPIGYQAIVMDPSPECSAQLLALAVDHIDTLLEDWYPTLGEYLSSAVVNSVWCKQCFTSLVFILQKYKVFFLNTLCLFCKVF